MSSGDGAGFKVFIEGLTCPPEEFALNLIGQGMDAGRVDELIHAIPCYLKTDVTRQVAVGYGEAFERAGGIIRIDSPGPVEVGLPPQPAAPARPAPAPIEVAPEPEAPGLEMSGFEMPALDSAGLEMPAFEAPAPASPASASPASEAPPVAVPSPEPPPADNVIPQLELRRPGDSSSFPMVSPTGGVRDLELDGAPSAPAPAPSAPAPANRPVVEELALDLGGPGAARELELDMPAESGGPSLELDVAEPRGGAIELEAAVEPDGRSLEIDLPPPREVPGADAPAAAGAIRGAGRPATRKPVVIRSVPEPEPEPWLKRRYPHLIGISILLIIASYLYGCTKVMSASVKFRRDVGEIDTALGNMNARGEVVTPAAVVSAVKEVGKRCGFDIASGDVTIEAEELRQVPVGRGRCRFAHVPDLVQRMSAVDQQLLMKSVQYCGAPGWILSVHVNSKARWGLFSHEIEATRTVGINSYEP